jgi:hypothetical protein
VPLTHPEASIYQEDLDIDMHIHITINQRGGTYAILGETGQGNIHPF